jgi:hypothetical protein
MAVGCVDVRCTQLVLKDRNGGRPPIKCAHAHKQYFMFNNQFQESTYH